MSDAPGSSPVAITCPGCTKRLRIRLDATSAERVRVRCPSCSHAFVVRRKVAGASETPAADVTASSGGAALLGDETNPNLDVQALSGSGPRGAGGAGRVSAENLAAERQSQIAHAPTWRAPQSSQQGSGESAHAFAIGEVVAQRWRIVRFIARGGMGEVYEAEDTALKEMVALKTVLPEIASSDRAIERFMREVSVARQVTHRNVCRIHDLGTHRGDSAVAARYPNGEIPFVTMEMLRGETLATRLTRGPMDPQDALPLIRQMAAGLDAAHAAGIVHRDFKGGNVILEPAADGLRVVVTDFGLARGAQPDGRFTATMTIGEGVLGSPAYMAPEQVDGRMAGPRADVYAFGTVVYEMVTGALPFRADNPLATAVKRLTENPIPPRQARPDLSEQWERAMLKALERSPEARFAAAGEMVAALEGRLEEPPSRAELEAAAKRPTPRRLLLAVVAGVLLALAIVAWVRVWQQRATDVEPGFEAGLTIPTSARSSVAVLGFDDLSGSSELNWLSTALSEMIASELGQGGELRLVPAQTVARFVRENALGDQRTLAAETLGRVRTVLGADYVLVGSFATIGEPPARQLRIDAKLQDTRAEGRGGAAARTAPESELFRLVAEIGGDLRTALGVGAGAAATPAVAFDLEAERAYSEGLDLLHRFELVGARDRFVAAIEGNPGEPRYHHALARTWLALGYRERAAAEATLAIEQGGAGLAQPEREALDLLRHEARGEIGPAADLAFELWRAAPDDIEAGLTLVRLYESAGRGLEAQKVLQVLERLPSVAATDPRLPLARATLAGAAGDFRRQLEAAAQAREAASQVGARDVVARAYLVESGAARQLGDPEAAKAAATAAREIFGELGDQPGAVAALSQAGAIAFDAGDLSEARRIFREALAAASKLGDRGAEMAIRNNLAVVLRQLGALDEADREYEALLAAAEEAGERAALVQGLNNRALVRAQRGELTEARTMLLAARPLADALGDQSLVAATRSNLGNVARKMGDLGVARLEQEAALVIRREIGQRAGIAASLVDLGGLCLDEGKLQDAEGHWNEALTTSREIAAKRFEANALEGLARLATVRGNLVEAREGHEEALALRRETGDAIAVAESRLYLARLDLVEEQREDAQVATQEVIAELKRRGARDLLVEAEAHLAVIELLSRRLDAARTAIDGALARGTGTEHARAQHELGLAAARVAAAQGRETEARRLLQETISRAQQAGLVAQELEAELMFGQLLIELGDRSGAARVEAVQDRASGLGFLVFASR